MQPKQATVSIRNKTDYQVRRGLIDIRGEFFKSIDCHVCRRVRNLDLYSHKRLLFNQWFSYRTQSGMYDYYSRRAQIKSIVTNYIYNQEEVPVTTQPSKSTPADTVEALINGPATHSASIAIDTGEKLKRELIKIMPFVDPDSTRMVEWIWTYRMAYDMNTSGEYFDIAANVKHDFNEMTAILKPYFTTYYDGPNLFRAFQSIADDTIPQLYVILEKKHMYCLSIFGDAALVSEIVGKFKSRYIEPKSISIETLTGFTSDGHVTKTAELKEDEQRFGKEEFYPFLEGQSIDEFVEEYRNGPSVLLLMGEWGTGKTTFLRTLLFKLNYESNALVSSESLLMHPGLSGWISEYNKDSVVVIEDADTFVSPREDDNFQMSMLLGTSDGVIGSNSKYIISTNLVSLNKVDSALTRPGRTFRVLVFGKLTPEEANAARIAVDLPPVEFDADSKYTLAEALNYKCVKDIQSRKADQVGFASSK